MYEFFILKKEQQTNKQKSIIRKNGQKVKKNVQQNTKKNE